MPLTKLGLKFNLGPSVFLQLLLALGPVILLASSLQTLIAANAKSYREAQSWLGLFTMIPLIPTMIMMVVPIKAQLWMFAVPLLAQHRKPCVVGVVAADRTIPAGCANCLACG